MNISPDDLDEVFLNNPLREVAFEIRFPFNLRINHEIYKVQSELSLDYPDVYRSVVESEEGSLKDIYVFEEKSEKRQIKLSEDDLTITFRQYSRFEVHLDEILRLTDLVSSKADIQTLKRVGLRYLNSISDETNLKSSDFLRKFFYSPIDVKITESDEFRQFAAEVLTQKSNCLLSSRNFYYQQPIKGEGYLRNVYLLDIDAFVAETVQLAELESILKELHHEIQIEFLSRITNEYKEQMRSNRS